VKNDVRDGGDLADLLRIGRLPEAWIASPQTRERRELVRYRATLVAIRSGLKAQIHAVLAKAGVLIAVSDLFGVTGHRLAKVPLGSAYAQRISSRWNSSTSGGHEARFAPTIAERLGPTAAIKRSSNYPARGGCRRWCRRRDWRHTPFRRPAPVVRRGHITKQGRKLVRWATVEAIRRQPHH
jgi:transposase